MRQTYQSSDKTVGANYKMGHPKIYYIRHGQTDWNAEFRFQGQTDIPLNDKGRKQANANGVKLRALIGVKPTLPFIASPLTRTRETMERVRSELDLPTEGYDLDDRLIEASYGDWEGTKLEDIKKNQNTLHRARKADRWGFQPPSGESHPMVALRIQPVLEEIKEDTVIVAHGMVGRVVRQLLLGLDIKQAGDMVFPQDKICVLCDGQEEFI